MRGCFYQGFRLLLPCLGLLGLILLPLGGLVLPVPVLVHYLVYPVIVYVQVLVLVSIHGNLLRNLVQIFLLVLVLIVFVDSLKFGAFCYCSILVLGRGLLLGLLILISGRLVCLFRTFLILGWLLPSLTLSLQLRLGSLLLILTLLGLRLWKVFGVF